MKGKCFAYGKPKLMATAFVSTWNTANTSAGSSTATQVKLPLYNGGNYNFTVDWGDSSSSTITAWNQAEVTHTYSASGTYTISITGICTGWRFNNTGDRLKILSISSWGALNLGNVTYQFYGCANLNLSGVTGFLDLTSSTLVGTFSGCTALTTIQGMSSWNISAITSLSATFENCTNFNQNIGSWNTANVTSMLGTFSGCTNFNQNIGSWNTANVTNMLNMFLNCTNFNQNIGSWNTANVTNMAGTFSGCTNFNQNIGSWNTVKVNDTSAMFQSCFNFNQNIGSWNTGLVTTMNNMFLNANAFNQNIGAWNVSNVTNFSLMLATFSGTSTFNNGGSSDINNWNTSAATTMNSMFYLATAFNQPIGNWNVSNVTNFGNFMVGKTAANFSTANLDAIYNGWSSRAVKPSITITFGTAKYTAGASAGRAILTGSPNNWAITDGGI